MAIEKRDRTELKTYFHKNSIPTESNFAELIDSMLNQKEDGIAKSPGEPLRIEADRDNNVGKKLINFYHDSNDPNPAWTFSLNPSTAGTANKGFSINDGNENSRLFIDSSTGNVGIGTVIPEKQIHIREGSISAPLLNETRRPGIALTGQYPELTLFSRISNPNHGSTIRLGSYDADTGNAIKQWVIGTSGRNSHFLDFGFSTNNNGNPHNGIRNLLGKTILTLLENGNVGIGTVSPDAKLHISSSRAELRIHNTNTRDWAFLRIQGSGSRFWDIAQRGDNDYLEFRPNGGNAGMVIKQNRNVGIGTTNPGFKLDVAGTIRFGGFTGNDTDEWPAVVWYRDLGAKWDEGLIKHSSGRGFFKRAGFGIHIDQTREWGIWSSGWRPLFGVEGGTGNVRVRGEIIREGDWGIIAGGTRSTKRVRLGELWGETGIYGLNGTLKLGASDDKIRYKGTWEKVSSKQLKNNIIFLSTKEAFETLGDLEPVTYCLKADEKKKRQAGFIAEDVPDLIASDDHTAIINDHIVAILTRVVKEQQKTIDAIQKKIGLNNFNDHI